MTACDSHVTCGEALHTASQLLIAAGRQSRLDGTGLLLVMGGAAWWHVNSLHLWSVELFFVFMVVHLWGKFWMAAWRGKRTLTWVTILHIVLVRRHGVVPP